MSNAIYGTHLMMQLSDIKNPSALDSAEKVENFLKDLVSHIGMRILAGPLVGYENATPENSGHSGVVILYESHAAIHTYPEIHEAFIDVFSCKTFEVEQVEEMLSVYLENYRIKEISVLSRGVHWGRDIKHELDRWSNSRSLMAEPS